MDLVSICLSLFLTAMLQQLSALLSSLRAKLLVFCPSGIHSSPSCLAVQSLFPLRGSQHFSESRESDYLPSSLLLLYFFLFLITGCCLCHSCCSISLVWSDKSSSLSLRMITHCSSLWLFFKCCQQRDRQQGSQIRCFKGAELVANRATECTTVHKFL